MLRGASRFTLQRFTSGCARLFRPYIALGLTLMVVYAISVGAYIVFVGYGYRTAEGRVLFIGWTFIAALAAAMLVAWFTVVNLLYLLVQIAMAVEGVGLAQGCRAGELHPCEFRDLVRVFLVIASSSWPRPSRHGWRGRAWASSRSCRWSASRCFRCSSPRCWFAGWRTMLGSPPSARTDALSGYAPAREAIGRESVVSPIGHPA
jgi:hypothetical protein